MKKILIILSCFMAIGLAKTEKFPIKINYDTWQEDFKQVPITTLDRSVFWDITFGYKEYEDGNKCLSHTKEYKTALKTRKIFINLGMEAYILRATAIHQHKTNPNVFMIQVSNIGYVDFFDSARIDTLLKDTGGDILDEWTPIAIAIEDNQIYFDRDDRVWDIEELRQMQKYPLCSKNTAISDDEIPNLNN